MDHGGPRRHIQRDLAESGAPRSLLGLTGLRLAVAALAGGAPTLRFGLAELLDERVRDGLFLEWIEAGEIRHARDENRPHALTRLFSGGSK